ncbi:AraJ Arabinose efflux permease [Pyrenophora tritici-repentis]|uniref:Arabinose efflux permease n=1 Tax=Pyrenophora tritici-repentis TaxID=45151 RepID=A0A316ZTT2_9PLEO|nr:Arabinose efflux permease [Pyrenophora tritici-repentis]KAI1534896.1 AraJ Arabinose efflux permease [Pyrenophora tritici-repentis]KAI1587215.1 AraJ Arabinose efflux permease [Pyrenophora tritici-repentis]KAI1599978.1 AraJ Arabinose efflux permease [Pyrenophora tritici-repentis]KAI1679426.1 MFS general substrate transporter [Pyrenophora tritici-repentis]
MTSVEPTASGAGETATTSTNETVSSTAMGIKGVEDVIKEDGHDAGIEQEEVDKQPSILQRAWTILTWTPPNCRYDPNKPPQFSMSLNILFAFAGGFTVANLYYNHPILNLLAHSFSVPPDRVSQIPTVMQAGYAFGLIFLCPLGDILPRRPFVCGLVFFTATLWLVLCITTDLNTFTAISFLVATTTVTPQLMLPLVGDLAPPHRRASALSIIVSGLMLGVLIARVLSGTIAAYTTWRAVYWMSLGLQYVIFILLWCFMPDYPSTNPAGVRYWRLIADLPGMLVKYPVLLQACAAGMLTSAPFTAFWTTLTFLLSSPPYNYSPLPIGLFGLLGISAMLLSPLYTHHVSDRYTLPPHYTALLGLSISLVGTTLGTALGPISLAGPVLQTLLMDFGNQTAQIANRTRIYEVEPKRRNGVNTVFMSEDYDLDDSSISLPFLNPPEPSRCHS